MSVIETRIPQNGDIIHTITYEWFNKGGANILLVFRIHIKVLQVTEYLQ